MKDMYNKENPIYFYCNQGELASIGLSILMKHGYRNLVNMTGIELLKKEGLYIY